MKVRFKLQAYMADNNANSKSFQRLRMRLINTELLRRRSANPKAPLSTNVWELDDGAIVGVDDLDEADVTKVFAVGLSVQTWRFLHSPVILNTVSLLDRDNRLGGVFARMTLKHISPQVVIDERFFLQAVLKLKTAYGSNSSRAKVLRAALNAYWDALHAVHTRSRFLSLSAALELAVNADRPKGKELGGRELIRFVAEGVDGFDRPEVHRLRKLNNTLKHARALHTYRGDVVNVGREAGQMKRLTDHLLAKRFSFELPPTYGK